MRGKTGDKRVNEALQKMLVDYLAAHPNESESAIGKRVGLTKAALNNMKNHAIGGGIKTIVGLSKLFGVTPWDLLRTAMGAGDLPAAVGMPLRLVDGWEEAGLGMPPEVGDTVPPRPIARVDRTTAALYAAAWGHAAASAAPIVSRLQPVEAEQKPTPGPPGVPGAGQVAAEPAKRRRQR